MPVHHTCVPRPPGVGAHLTQLLSLAKWLIGEGCGCEDRARELDAWGPDECERRIEEIVADLVRVADEKVSLAKFAPRGTKEAAARLAVEEAIRRVRTETA